MKKMKIMLLSFALLAIVGAALAFKAKTLTEYCTTLSAGGSTPCNNSGGAIKACPNYTTLTIGSGSTRFTYCYTTPLVGRTDCKKAGGVIDLDCNVATTSFKNNGD